MKMRETPWSAAACCRFPRASLLAPFRHCLRRAAGKPACKERRQAAALQGAFGRTIFMATKDLHFVARREEFDA
jgi:hypothetical protein